MKKSKTVATLSGIVTDLQRVNTSRNGNPRYMFVVDGAIVYTAVDCSYGYSISNYEGREIVCNCRVIRGKLTLVNIH